MNEKTKTIALMAANIFPQNAFYLDKQLQSSIDQAVKIAHKVYDAVEADAATRETPTEAKKAKA